MDCILRTPEPEVVRAERAVRAVLPPALAEAVITDDLFGRLVWQLHLAELDGANPVAVLRELAEEFDFLDEQRNPADYLAGFLPL